MNTHRFPTYLALAVFFVIRHSSFVIAQGALAPSGPPALTLRSLDEVEARTPISSAPFTISTGGSYYLTRNLAVTSGDAIFIGADDGTLDLNGFTLSSTASPASGTAISFGSGLRRNITIRNGIIRGTTTFVSGTFTPGGFLNGINVIAFGANVRVADLMVLGVANDGINLTNVRTCSADRCLVEICGGRGISAGLVRDCSATQCGGDGILGVLVRNSYGESVGTSASSRGIEADTAIRCIGVAAGGDGIFADLASTSQGTSTSDIGITANVAGFCRGRRDGGQAISAFIATGCTVEGTGTVTSSRKSLGTP